MVLKEKFPKSIIIEPTDACNLKCVYCPRRFMKEPVGFMDFDMFKNIIDEIRLFNEREIVLFHRGESLLHPEIMEMLWYVKGQGKVLIATNGTLLTKDISRALVNSADFISFSIDLPENFKTVRGGDYALVESNIKYLTSINEKSVVQVSMVQTDEVSDYDAQRFIDIWKDKVDRVRVYIEHSKDSHYGSVAGPDRPRQTCTKPFRQMVIEWDGKVRRCNHDWEGTLLGDVNNQSIIDVWNGKAYQSLRNEQNSLKIESEPCKSCGSWYENEVDATSGKLYQKGAKVKK